MKKKLLLLTCLSAFVLTANAQNIVDKINKTNDKINNTGTAINHTSDAINNSSKTVSNAGNALSNFGKSVGGLTKRKQKKETGKSAATSDSAKQAEKANIVKITIAGVDYASLKKLKESLKSVPGVQSIEMNFSSSGSSLSVASDKNADDLWAGVPNDVSIHYNIISLNNDSISVAYKQ